MSFEYVICVVKLKKNEQNLSKVGDRSSKHHSYLDLKDNSIRSVKVRNCQQQQKFFYESVQSERRERGEKSRNQFCCFVCFVNNANTFSSLSMSISPWCNDFAFKWRLGAILLSNFTCKVIFKHGWLPWLSRFGCTYDPAVPGFKYQAHHLSTPYSQICHCI